MSSPDNAPAVNDYAIMVKDLTRDFGDFRAVDHVNFSVRRGQIFGFLGPNGSGKTTTIRMLLGLLKPSAGEAIVLGKDISHQTAAVRPRMGYMSQKFSLYDDLTVVENLRFYGRTYGLKGAKLQERIAFVLEMANLTGREKERASNLSGGWRQRLALGAAILHEPDLVFLDEPTAGVDPVSRRAFWELLYDIAATGVTVFVTTHYMDEAEHCEELAFIHDGRIIAQGSPELIKETMMRGEVIELSPSSPGEAMAALNKAQLNNEIAAEEVALYGAQIHVVAAEASHLISPIQSLLGRLGIDSGPIQIIPPSLEDVFISCIRQGIQP